MELLNSLQIKSILVEQPVLLEKRGLRAGSFDFLIETKTGKAIGIEVLTRPSKGKLKGKLPYSLEVDEFVFVLPSSSLEFYQKKEKKGFRSYARANAFSREFNKPNLKAWLFDVQEKAFQKKDIFNRIFNVKK